MGYALSVFLHGRYDSAATLASHGSDGAFLLAALVIYATVLIAGIPHVRVYDEADVVRPNCGSSPIR